MSVIELEDLLLSTEVMCQTCRGLGQGCDDITCHGLDTD